MKFLTFVITVLLISLPMSASAQSLGGITGDGSGTSGNGSSTGTSGSGSGAGTSSSDSSFSTDFGTTIETPTAQEFDQPASRGFIGSGKPDGFVGVDEIYESTSSNSSSSNRQTVTSNRSTNRQTVRRTTNRTSTSSRTSGTSGGRTVRAATTADFDYISVQPSQRTVEMLSHLSRLPNLEDVEIQLGSTPGGTVATLTGTFTSEKQKKLATQLLLLEPGVDKVIVKE
ncbi:hypothetical protein FACS1894189_4790 [Planctomycetales bacterium]|nr:hypothetical protein FACS1894189_4790 [Planctomycetales bacterium]